MWKVLHEEICGKYEEVCGKYEENMKEYLLLYRLWDLEKFQDLLLYIGFGTWKNS